MQGSVWLQLAKPKVRGQIPQTIRICLVQGCKAVLVHDARQSLKFDGSLPDVSCF